MMTSNQRNNKPINGILLLDKPLHLTSNGALQRVKNLFGAKKVGHTGSLDPLATGMLPLCFGEATKLCQYLLDSDKYYDVVVKFGKKTKTGDAEGAIIETGPTDHITLDSLQNTLQQFIGTIEQIPPMFSAIKQNGKRLYEFARKGIEVERKSRAVQIYKIKLNYVGEKDSSQSDIQMIDRCHLSVQCSKGTYIRTLVEDIGAALATCAYVGELRRTCVSPYQDMQMITISQLQEICREEGPDALLKCLLPLESSIQHYPIIKLSPSSIYYLRAGQSVEAPHFLPQGFVRIFSEKNVLIGVGEIQENGQVAPRRLLRVA